MDEKTIGGGMEVSGFAMEAPALRPVVSEKRSPRRFTNPRLLLEFATSLVASLLRRAGRIPGAQPE